MIYPFDDSASVFVRFDLRSIAVCVCLNNRVAGSETTSYELSLECCFEILRILEFFLVINLPTTNFIPILNVDA